MDILSIDLYLIFRFFHFCEKKHYVQQTHYTRSVIYDFDSISFPLLLYYKFLEVMKISSDTAQSYTSMECRNQMYNRLFDFIHFDHIRSHSSNLIQLFYTWAKSFNSCTWALVHYSTIIRQRFFSQLTTLNIGLSHLLVSFLNFNSPSFSTCSPVWVSSPSRLLSLIYVIFYVLFFVSIPHKL